MPGRSRDRARSRCGGKTPRVLYSFDFTGQSAGAASLPTGLTFARASSGHTVQAGSNTLLENNGGSINLGNNVGRIGRLNDAQQTGIFVEPPRSNFFPNNRRPDIWAAGTWASTASGNADAAGGNAAYRVTVASGGTGRYYATGNVTGTYTASAWHAKGPGIGTYQLFAGYSGVSAIAVAGTASNWARTVATATVAGQQFYNLPMYGGDGSSNGGAGSGARDALVDFAQIEVGMYPTSVIGTAGSTGTRAGEQLSIDSTRAAASLVSGRLGVYLRFRALAASTELGSGEGTLLAWAAGSVVVDPTSTYLKAIDGALYSQTANAAISWSRYDLLEFVVEAGAGKSAIRWRVNGGSVNAASFSTRDDTLGSLDLSAGLDVCNAAAGGQFPSIIEKVVTFAPGWGPM